MFGVVLRNVKIDKLVCFYYHAYFLSNSCESQWLGGGVGQLDKRGKEKLTSQKACMRDARKWKKLTRYPNTQI